MIFAETEEEATRLYRAWKLVNTAYPLKGVPFILIIGAHGEKDTSFISNHPKTKFIEHLRELADSLEKYRAGDTLDFGPDMFDPKMWGD